MDGGAWKAAVHGVAKSRKRLSDFTFTFPFHVLEKEIATHSSVLAWRIPGTAEPGGLPSMGSHRVGHDWSDLAAVEKAMAPHSSTLAWKIPRTEEPGGLQSRGSHRVGHDWSDLAAVAAAILFLVWNLSWSWQFIFPEKVTCFMRYQSGPCFQVIVFSASPICGFPQGIMQDVCFCFT